MEMSLVWTIARRELREALRSKWLALYALGFAGLALALSGAAQSAGGYGGLGGFGRTAASLVNAILLFVPLLGLTSGAACLAGDRERGTLLYLLSQPVSRAEVFSGKALGAGLGLTGALAGGFGLAGLALALSGGGQPGSFLGLAGYAWLLALATLGSGLVISSLARKTAAALGAALVVWLALVFLSDLGLAGVTLALRPSPASLLALLVLNPLQVFKLGAIYNLHSSLDTLGAVGQYALYRFGPALPWLLAGLLLAWAGLTAAAAFVLFVRRAEA